MTEAEDPRLLGFNNAAFFCGKALISLKQRRQPAELVEPPERICVHSHLGGIENFAPCSALANLRFEKGRAYLCDDNWSVRYDSPVSKGQITAWPLILGSPTSRLSAGNPNNTCEPTDPA